MPFPRQQIQLVGNIGKEPESRFTPQGQQVLGFSLAVTREWDQDGTKHKETTWFQVTAWAKVAEQAGPILHKGQQVLVVGRLKPDPVTGAPRLWTRQDGSAGSSFELVATEIWLSVYQGQAHGQPAAGEPAYSDLPPEDDVPF